MNKQERERYPRSDKPTNADYSAAAHAHRLQAVIDFLGLKSITLVVTDFGGAIGLLYREHPARRYAQELALRGGPLNEGARPRSSFRSYFRGT